MAPVIPSQIIGISDETVNDASGEGRRAGDRTQTRTSDEAALATMAS